MLVSKYAWIQTGSCPLTHTWHFNSFSFDCKQRKERKRKKGKKNEQNEFSHITHISARARACACNL